ncbi:hypothetical protein [Actinoplanes sp. NPDC089786]|uniref:hypothetical protein n=1 Tax=Actinoplanes sp. NPDC089786 TaxID=3155185 RepID=UPI0034124844
MDALERIAFDRLGLVVTPAGPATPAVAAPLLAEFAHAGVRFANPGAVTDGLAGPHHALIAHVREKRGEKGRYAPLFAGFPDRLPEFDDASFRFVVARARMAGEEHTDERWRRALDFSDLGWWPASSIPQDQERADAARRAQAALPRDRRVEWLTVRLVSPAELEAGLREWMRDCFGSAASLREDVRADLGVLVKRLGVDGLDPAEVRFRENRTLLFELIWAFERGRLPSTGATPDDLLRLFAALTGGDASLFEPIRYPRLSRSDRRVVVNTLEASERLGDVFRRRGLWLAIDRGLHVGEFRAPRVRETFARLRETRHDRSSFPSRFERLLATDYPAAVRLAAAESPGLLGRGLRYAGPEFDALAEAYTGWMLRDDATSKHAAFDPATVVNAFALTGRKRYVVPMLLDLDTHEILYVDVHLNGAPRAHVEREGHDIATLVSAVAARRNTKLSVAALARRHVRVRGAALVTDPAQATITFGTTAGHTYDALNPSKLLADLL